MLKKSILILSVAATYYVQAQDASVLRNSIEVYQNPLLGGSAKYNAMAGSMGALGGDVSVIASNPAGVGVAIAGDVSGTLVISGSENITMLNNQSYDYKINDTDLGHVGGIAVFGTRSNSPWKFVNLGFSVVRSSIEDYSESPGNNSIAFNLPDSDRLLYNGHAYNRLGDVTKMALAVGGNYDNRFYLGAGINLHGATLSQYDSAAMKFENSGDVEVFNKQYTPYYEDASGFSASVGVIGKLNNQIRLGASLETPTWWSIERSYEFYGYDSADDGLYGEDRGYKTPMKATLSAAYVPTKNFALNVDYAVGLSKPEFSKMDVAAQEEINTFLDANYQNFSEVKVGMEYRMNQVRLRGGYSMTTSPFEDISLQVNQPSGSVTAQTLSNLYAGERENIGLGIGYDFRSFYLDAAYNMINSTYKSPFLAGSSTAGTEYYSPSAYFDNDASVVSDVENKRSLVSLTFGWKF